MDNKEYLDKLKKKIDDKQAELTAMAKLLDGSNLRVERDLLNDRVSMLEKFWKHVNFVADYENLNLEKEHADRIFDGLPLI